MIETQIKEGEKLKGFFFQFSCEIKKMEAQKILDRKELIFFNSSCLERERVRNQTKSNNPPSPVL